MITCTIFNKSAYSWSSIRNTNNTVRPKPRSIAVSTNKVWNKWKNAGGSYSKLNSPKLQITKRFVNHGAIQVSASPSTSGTRRTVNINGRTLAFAKPGQFNNAKTKVFRDLVINIPKTPQISPKKPTNSRFKLVRGAGPQTTLNRRRSVSHLQTKPFISKSKPVNRNLLRRSRPFGSPATGTTLKTRYKLINRSQSKYKIDRRTKSAAVANRILRSSIQTAVKSKTFKTNNPYKTNASKQRQRYCLYFIRYGRCARGDKCPLEHDPAKVAVCTRFLRGTCQIDKCPFSHVISQDKMPLCRFYLLGNCTKPDCPYLHVKHDASTAICPDFELGYCPKGSKCEKKHFYGKRSTKLNTNDTKKQKVLQLQKFRSDISSKIAAFRQNNAAMQEKKSENQFLPEYIPLPKLD